MELLWDRIRNNKSAFVGLLVLILGIFIIVIAIRQPTQLNQNASGVTNLNAGGDSIGNTNNKDGTMGPANSISNFSAKLSKSQTGTMILTLSDPPSLPKSISSVSAQNGLDISSLIIQIKKVEVHLTTFNSQNVDHWETLDIPSPMSVNLYGLSKGAVVNLGQTTLASGKYTEMRIYIQNATETLTDGSNINLNIVGKDNIIRLMQTFNVANGINTTVVVNFDMLNSVLRSGNNYSFKPVISKFLSTL